jgi:hypothetical protein
MVAQSAYLRNIVYLCQRNAAVQGFVANGVTILKVLVAGTIMNRQFRHALFGFLGLILLGCVILSVVKVSASFRLSRLPLFFQVTKPSAQVEVPVAVVSQAQELRRSQLVERWKKASSYLCVLLLS